MCQEPVVNEGKQEKVDRRPTQENIHQDGPEVVPGEAAFVFVGATIRIQWNSSVNPSTCQVAMSIVLLIAIVGGWESTGGQTG